MPPHLPSPARPLGPVGRWLLALLAIALLPCIPALASIEPWSHGPWNLELDSSTGALVRISHAQDPHAMNWLREAGHWDHTKWLPDTAPGARSRGGQWGLVETTHSGLLHAARSRQLSPTVHEAVYEAPAFTVTVRRELLEDGLHESYTFRNTSIIELSLPAGSVSLSAPLFDQYPGTAKSLAQRCHAHLWMGGSSSWINATRMGTDAPHLGLVLTEGSLDSYSQRGATFGDRGSFLLHPSAMTLRPNGEHTIAWRLFWHQGWDDFDRILAGQQQCVRLSAQRYVVQAGSPLEISATSGASLEGATLLANGRQVPMHMEGKVLRATLPTSAPGEIQVELLRGNTRTWLRANAIASPDALIDARVRFIVARQQRKAPGDPLDGAYLAYDNETGKQVYSTQNDHNAGRERTAMGVLGALYLPLCRDEAFRTELAASLQRYAAFYDRELEDEAGTVYGSVGRTHHERLYNFPWAAHLHLALYWATHDGTQLDRMVRVLRRYYALGGARYYAIGIQVHDTLATLAAAGRDAERAELLALFRGHADQLLANGTNYPPFEVNYEQSIVAPAVQLLLEVHRVTGEAAYLEGARRQMRVLEAFAGRQPDHRLNEVALRHWDDFWFGKIRSYGDTLPHYWSTLNALAYTHYAAATGETAWNERARSVLWANLSLFKPDGSASAAHLYARTTNGIPADRNDPWANDQDWTLVNLLTARKHGTKP